MTTHVTGTYANCGYGLPFAATATCAGPNCYVLSEMPGFVCTNTSQVTLVCTNQVTCATPSNLTSNFTVDQTGITIVDNVGLQIENDSFSVLATATATIPFSAAAVTTVLASKGYKLNPFSIFTLFILFLAMTPLAFAQAIPPAPSDVVNGIFQELTSSTIFKGIYQWASHKVCSIFVSTGVQQALLAAGDAVTEELKEAEGVLIVDCTELVEALLIEDPPGELLMAVASKWLCPQIVASIMRGPFNMLGSEICQAIESLGNNSTAPPGFPSVPMAGMCSCLAPTCICPEDDGLPPTCGTTRDSSCGLCSCSPNTEISSPIIPPTAPTTTMAAPPPTTTQRPPPPTTTFSPPPTTTQPPPPPPPHPTTTTAFVPPPTTPQAPPPMTSMNTCSCLAPTCICPDDNGLPPICGTTPDPGCGICMC